MQKNDIKIEDMNIEQVRNQFPIFTQKINGYPIIYFDSASTAQMPQSVVDAIVAYYTTYKANVGRGLYTFAEKATQAYEHARANIAQFISAQAHQIIFTSGTTGSINLIVQAWALQNLEQGDEIIVSAVEHHSNFLPWQQLALHKKLILKIIPVTNQGIVDVVDFKKYLTSKTKLVCIVHTSNVIGGSNDVTTLTKTAHAVGAKVVVDAAQSIAHQVIDVAKIGCDFLAFSGHKLFGPTGVGVLYVADSVQHQMSIVSFGGGMVFSVQEHASVFKEFPYSFQAGTPHVAGVIGLSAAVDFMNDQINMSQLAIHENDLAQTLYQGLQKLKDIQIISCIPSAHQHVHMVTFYSAKHHAHDIAAYLDQYGIAVRAGHHCAQLFHQQCNITASIRVSFSVYNTQSEVQFFLQCLKKFLD